MRNKLMTLCALVVCVPALAFAQAGGGAGGGGAGGAGTAHTGGGSQSGGQGAAAAGGGTAMNVPRTKAQRLRDSLILKQRVERGDTGQGNQQGYHGTQALTTPPRENMGTQSDTGQANAAKNDTSKANAQGQAQGQSKQANAQQGKDTVTSSAAGAIAPAGNQGLSKSDVKQLQTALDSLGCNAGPKDGIIGPKTRAAIKCGEQKTSANNLQDLGQKLNINISGNAAAGANAASDTTGTHAVKGGRRQTSGQNAGRIRPVPKKSDTSAASQQGQQGAVDTSTSKGAIDTSFSHQRDTTQMNQRDTTQFNRGDTTQMNRSDTTQMNRSDTTQMNRSDTTQMNRRDTTQMNRSDTTQMNRSDTTLRDTTNANQRDTTMLRDTTRMRDTTMMRDTSSTRPF